ncbi:MAG: SUMF1/EgtB/PvdO family nonheme iron enzyme [Hyphomonas sp.]|uniref:SUMF1/EgtB/PvdO family nonheme iron enzyme n=1 Tax=Hyphomonas sp. TaxID=87 RepID=UPI003529BA42
MGEERVYREEGPVRTVCLEPFQMTATEVTNAQFAEFIASTGYVTRAERGWKATETDGPGIDIPPASAAFSPSSGSLRTPLSWWKLVERRQLANAPLDHSIPNSQQPMRRSCT